MKRVSLLAAVAGSFVFIYACNNDDPQNTPTPSTSSALTATINSQGLGTTGTSTATGTFAGNLDRTASVMSYTVTYSGVTPTAITLDPVSSSATSGSVSTSSSILLAGRLPTVSTPGSGTSTTPGSGTSTTPGSGTSTTPGSGTSTTPGSGTTTTPGSGTTTNPGTGTTTTPGSGTTTTPGTGTSTTPGSGTAVSVTSPVSGTISVSAGRADSLSRGLYRVNIRSTTYPNGEVGGVIQTR